MPHEFNQELSTRCTKNRCWSFFLIPPLSYSPCLDLWSCRFPSTLPTSMLSLHTPWRRIVGNRVWRRTLPPLDITASRGVPNQPFWQYEKMGYCTVAGRLLLVSLFSLSSGIPSEHISDGCMMSIRPTMNFVLTTAHPIVPCSRVM